MNAPVLSCLSGDAAERAAVLAEIDQLRAQLAMLENRVMAGMALPGASLFPRVWIDRLAEIVAFEFGVDTRDLRGSAREARFTRPRFVWVWLVHQIAGASYPQTARLTGYGDHTSALHAFKRVVGWRRTHPEFAHVTDQLLQIGRALRTGLGPAEMAAGLSAEASQ